MKYKYFTVTLYCLLLIATNAIFSVSMPLKEIVRISSLRENQLFGYGLVIGLSRTGDSKNFLALETLERFLASQNIKFDKKLFRSRNIAAVLVTAKIPAINKPGDHVDIWISSIGDSKSLNGGYLIQTPLQGADQNVYAVAQTSILSAHNSMKRSSGNKANNTVYISNGAIVEKQIQQSLLVHRGNNNQVGAELNLINFNIHTALNIVKKINSITPNVATLETDGLITLTFPDNVEPIAFLGDILLLPVEVKPSSKVVIDPRNNTIVMGGSVGISSIAVSRDNMKINIHSTNEEGSLVDKSTMQLLEPAPTVSELVDSLNQLGLSVTSIINIIKAIHAAGALHAELEIL